MGNHPDVERLISPLVVTVVFRRADGPGTSVNEY